MKISLNWLNDYIDIKNYHPQDLADIFTGLGIEVETIEHVSPITGEVVVGEVIETTPHPNADSLQLCKVDVGKGSPATIVCGAKNARAGIKVAAALVGSKLPGDFKIKASKIRGEKSEGMLCSEVELQIGTDDSGIVEIAETAKVGDNIIDLFNVSDTIFELGLTPNRADCNGYIGLARDLSAKLGLPLKKPEIYQNAHTSTYKTADVVSIEISEDDSCGRFCALAVRGVQPSPSPMWMQRRLEMSGMRPVNSIVDATNYVMLEYGQPIHAYDSRSIAGGRIVVRDAKAGEKTRTLDGQEQQLQDQDIVICDENNVIGIAGIMGGENSEVKSDTSEIVLEVATFHPIKIRKTAKRLGIHSEASHRFERGTDIDACDVVCHRVAGLIAQLHKELNGVDTVEISADVIDCYPKPLKRPMIALRIDRLRQISGDGSYDAKLVADLLRGLGIVLMDQKDERLLFQIPTWRHDIFREIDLIEEVMRLRGFENLRACLPIMEIKPLKENRFVRFNEQLRTATAGQGFCETMSFPFASSKDLENLLLPVSHPLQKTLRLKNPIASEENLLSPIVVLGLLKALERNRRSGETEVRLFESARAYFHRDASDSKGYFSNIAAERVFLTSKAKSEPRPIEIPVLAGVIGQPRQGKGWNSDETSADFYSGKKACVDILHSIGLRELSFEPIEDEELPYLHPGASALIKAGQTTLGYVGELHPKTSASFGFEAGPVVFELLIENLMEATANVASVDSKQFKFPPTTRDLALVIPRDITYSQVTSALTGFRKRNMQSYRLFDLYQGEKIEEGYKSLAFNFTFQSSKKTLNDREVDKEIELLLAHLNKEVGARLR